MEYLLYTIFFFFSSRRRHTRFDCDWSSDVCSSDLPRCRSNRPKVTARRSQHPRANVSPKSAIADTPWCLRWGCAQHSPCALILVSNFLTEGGNHGHFDSKCTLCRMVSPLWTSVSEKV